MHVGLWALLSIWVSSSLSASLQPGYHNYKNFSKYLIHINRKYLNTTHLYSIGKSVQGRELWVLAIAGDSPGKHLSLRPEVKYIANMHGNEVLGHQLLIYLIDYLVTNQGIDTRVTTLLQSCRIHILVSMNPDGLEKAISATKGGDCHSLTGRNNAHGYDLNRNFPDMYKGTTRPIQPETEAVIRWLQSVPFLLSAQLHSGSLVASYPYDSHQAEDIPKYAKTVDDDVFRSLALAYAHHHPGMAVEYACPGEDPFRQGITNGAQWYPSSGGMQDYNYIHGGCFEITLELSCCQFPNVSELPQFWEDNKESLLAYLERVNGPGIRGLVTDYHNKPIAGAWIILENREFPVYKTTSTGEFWRLISSGKHKLMVTADGYQSTGISFRAKANTPTVMHIKLKQRQFPLPLTKEDYHTGKEDNIISLKTLFAVLILTVYSSLYLRRYAVTESTTMKTIQTGNIQIKSKLTSMHYSMSNSKVLACVIMVLLASGIYIKHNHEIPGKYL